MKKIFLIGFNKCGTLSLHNFFINNGIRSIHWDHGLLAQKIYSNKEKGLGLLEGYEQYQAYTDMVDEDEIKEREVAVDLFTELYNEYPDAIFIFNDRDEEKWIQSRINHGRMVERAQKRLGLDSIDKVIDVWSARYREHKRRVFSFFEGKPNFIYFKIDADNAAAAFADQLSEKGIVIKARSFPHAHKTGTKPKTRFEDGIPDEFAPLFRDAAIAFEKSDPLKAFHLMETAHIIRPEGPYILSKLNQYREQLGLKADNDSTDAPSKKT